jgi:formylglycine-generating enzyme
MRSPKLRHLALLALAYGCNGILGIEPPASIIECLTDADCEDGICVDHRCVLKMLCASPNDCPAPASECEIATCANGACGKQALPAGKVPGEQPRGDCQVRTCDGRGKMGTESDPSDADDGDDCTVDTCESGSAVHQLKQAGSPCAQNGGTKCDASGRCVSCSLAPDGLCAECTLGDKDCLGDVPRVCGPDGRWSSLAACNGATPVCAKAECTVATPTSCKTTSLTCGSQSCCAVAKVDGGTFSMGWSLGDMDAPPAGGGPDENPSHGVIVSDFYLDIFTVTVGRFRKFVEAYPDWKPAAGAGRHPLIDTSGWDAAWDGLLPKTQAELRQKLAYYATSTWTDAPTSDDPRPINTVNWYLAFAFCMWDGGRLPTEAEWEYAAAGGGENRLYPWDNDPPNSARAVYGCLYDGLSACSKADIAHVGSKPNGMGLWKHLDLAGNMSQWVLDAYASDWYRTTPGGAVCDNCANTAFAGAQRVVRGGSWGDYDEELRAAARSADQPTLSHAAVSFRCARPAAQ